MPDLSSLVESLRGGLSGVPPIVIGLALLVGPTLAFVGYQFVSSSRRVQSAGEAEAVPFWVCHECRSINQLRHPRCYHCGIVRAASEDLEIIVEEPIRAPAFFEAPEGSPFAALGARRPFDEEESAASGPGVPVMASRPSEAVAVGPGKGDAWDEELEPRVVTRSAEGTR
jgi:hypothetical protein